MFDLFVEATHKLIATQDFPVYQDPTSPGRKRKSFEEVWSTLVKKILHDMKAPVQDARAINQNGSRLYDLVLADDLGYAVCEFGHQDTHQGYLNNYNGKPKRKGLVNKLFMDYLKNFHHKGAPKHLRSYAYLYFTLFDGYDEAKVNELFSFIRGMYPANHRIELIDVIRNGVLLGRIMIIDKIETFSEVQALFATSVDVSKFVSKYEKPFLSPRDKHFLLRGT